MSGSGPPESNLLLLGGDAWDDSEFVDMFNAHVTEYKQVIHMMLPRL
jgi:hypothetical protein